MKRTFCLILCLFLLSALMACDRSSKNIQTPVAFYYKAAQVEFNTAQGVINQEIREGQLYAGDLQKLLNAYLAGPESESLVSPYPSGVQVSSIVSDGDKFQLTLTPEFAQLSGYPLTIACACLSMTIMEYTQCNSVLISAEDSLLDGVETISMSRENLLLLDLITPEYPDE